MATGDVGIQAENKSNATDLNITANNVTGGTYGIYADNDGSGALSITTTGTVTGTGDGGTGDGIYANNASTEDLTITIADGGSVSTSGTDVANDFAIEAIANNGAVIVDNFGTVTGRVNLTNSNTFTNAGTWDLAGTTSDFNAQGNSLVVNEGLIIAASDSAVDEVSAIDNLDIFRSNAGGTIRLVDGAAGDVFRIDADAAGGDGDGTGNFVANGGMVELDVELGGDASAADTLDISGDVTLDGAPTGLLINPVGNSVGGETTTGIEVVTVAGSSEAGAFTLARPVEVGLLAYDLSLGQCDDASTDNWYLCYGIGTTGAVFEALPGALLAGFGQVDPLHERLGGRTRSAGLSGEDEGLAAQAVGPWIRAWGDRSDITPDSSTAGAAVETDRSGFEAGLGLVLGAPAGGELIGGVTLRHGQMESDVVNPVGSGTIDAEGTGIGLSLTWFGETGLYVDMVAAHDAITVDARSQGGGELLDGYDTHVLSASGEVGQRVSLGDGLTVVPQAQLSWAEIGDTRFEDALGNRVELEDRDRLTGRLGVSVEQAFADGAWGAGEVYGFGNLMHDFREARSVMVGDTRLTQSGGGSWAEIGGGVSVRTDALTEVYGQVSYREAVAEVEGDAMAVSAGLRVQW